MKSSENSFETPKDKTLKLDKTRKPLFPQLEQKNLKKLHFFLSENVACQKISNLKNITIPKIKKVGPFGLFKNPVSRKISTKLKKDIEKISAINWEMGFFNSVTVPKMWKDDHLEFFTIPFVVKLKRGAFGAIQNFWKKSYSAEKHLKWEKIAKGGSLVCFWGSGRRFSFGRGSDVSSMFWTFKLLLLNKWTEKWTLRIKNYPL